MVFRHLFCSIVSTRCEIAVVSLNSQKMRCFCFTSFYCLCILLPKALQLRLLQILAMFMLDLGVVALDGSVLSYND